MFLLAVGVVIGLVIGILLSAAHHRPPEVPSIGFFLQDDRAPSSEAELRRRTAREAIEDWREAFAAESRQWVGR